MNERWLSVDEIAHHAKTLLHIVSFVSGLEKKVNGQLKKKGLVV